MTFAKWLDTFIAEKGIDTDAVLEVEGASGANFIPVACVIEQLKAFPTTMQATVKTKIVQIDFVNGDVLHFIKYIAAKMAI